MANRNSPTLNYAWRLTKAAHANLSGDGAKRFGARWNLAGKSVVYLSLEPALCLLEVLVHFDLDISDLPSDYVMMKVDFSPWANLPKNKLLSSIVDEKRSEFASQEIGDSWLTHKKTPCLKVPSIIVSGSYNLLLNPEHELMLSHPLTFSIEPFIFDPRLV